MNSVKFEIFIEQWEPDSKNKVKTYFSLCFKKYFNGAVAFLLMKF